MGAQVTVLVVDDDPAIRLLCRVNLELDGHAVSEAGTLDDARDAMEVDRFDLVILDVHVAGGDGRDLLAELRRRKPDLPVALLTGSANRNELLRTGADALIPKPFTLEELRDTVEQLSRGRRLGGRSVSATAVRSPTEYEQVLQRYLFERSEEGRAVRVGEKEVSEQATIVERYSDLFSREQLDALHAAEESASDDERERLYRLRLTCEGGLISAELAADQDALENSILSSRLTWRGEELPLRAAQARLAVLDDYGDRDELGELHGRANAGFNPERTTLMTAGEELAAELSGEPDPVRRNEEEKGISLRELEQALAGASDAYAERWEQLRDKWFERLLGADRAETPSSSHVAYMRRLSPLEPIYTKERALAVCIATLGALGFEIANEPNIRLDLDDRPQKNPRACVIASDPPKVVHLITRAQGGLHDYQAFLHEAGHALHYAGVDAALPYTFRRLARDHALTEIYSYILEAISREPGWHAQHFGLSDSEAAENAEATSFVEGLLFRRYTAKLGFELDFWRRFAEQGPTADGYADALTAATGVAYRRDAFLSDMDSGFYSADYLRAWIRSAQLRTFLIREVGEDWWRRPETGERLRQLFREGTRPTSEELAARLGIEPLDTAPLLAELTR